jgi:hypothetical protein
VAGKIFINYRRDDSAAHALNISQYLERAFGSRNVFIDIDRVRAGQRFPEVLERRLAKCKVMVAVIGPNWLDARDDSGRRRLDERADWVRLEIVRALARNITVMPVMVGGASLPKKDELPEELQPLLDYQAVAITTNGFRSEMAGLLNDIRAIPRPSPWRVAIFVVGSAFLFEPRVPIFAKLMSVPVVFFGLYIVAGRFPLDAWIRRGVYYAVTDKRILILRSWPFSKFTAISLDKLSDVNLNEHSDGRSCG